MDQTAWKIVLLVIVAAGVYLAGNGRTSLFDRDEPRYAQCSRQMLDSGDWVVPRLYDKIRAAKPPGIYWCQATAMKVFGENAFAARFPSAVATVLMIALLGFAFWPEVGPRQTLWTLFVYSTTALVIFAAKMAMTDAVLNLATLSALLSIYALWTGRGKWIPAIILSIALGIGGLIKGPFILGVLAGVLACLWLLKFADRRWWPQHLPPGSLTIKPAAGVGTRVLQIIVGLAIVAALVAPWLIMINHREPSFLHAATVDARQHLENGSEGHTGWPGFHLIVIWGTYLPWSLLLPLAIGLGFANRRDPRVRFALASVLGSWIFAEILQTKLPHYMLPAMPGLAFLTADAITRCLNGQSNALTSKGIRIGAGVIGVVILALSTVLWWWLAFAFHSFPWIALISLTTLGIVYGCAVWLFFHKRKPLPGLLSMGIGSMATGMMLFGVYFPSAEPLRLSIRAANVLKENEVIRPGQVLMLDYKEPSLAFYQGGTIREAKHSLPVVEHIDTAPPWMVMTRQIWDKAPASSRAKMEIIGHPLRGFNYSDSLRPAELLIVRKRS
jgi:4-amino-4-deoxy-L-arabinose transferase-like glycosyltransferase